MKGVLSKTIYIVFLILYIFVSYSLPLSVDFQAYQKTNVDIKGDSYSTIYNIAKVNSISTNSTFKTDTFASIHQYDDEKYSKQDFQFTEYVETRDTASEPAGYSYHKNPYNDKEVLGFMPYWSLSEYRNIQYNRMSTLAYFSLTCDNTGAWIRGYLADDDGDGDKEWSDDGGYVGFNSANFVNMVSRAHAAGTKVVLLVKNFDPYSIRQIVRNNDNAGDRLINNIIAAINTKSLDGVNIDFEYVPHKDNDVVTDDLRADFAQWHDKLADTIHAQFPKSHVSTDTFGSAGVSYSIYDMTALGKTSLDYIVMMTYDYIVTSCWDGKKMTPMSPLYGNNVYGTPNWNVASHLAAGAAKAGSRKILMGVPYYGIDFRVKSDDRELYNARVNYPTCGGRVETYRSIVDPKYDQYHNSTTLRWNDTEKARWYVYPYSGTWRHGYYDDARSLGAKYDYVRSANLGGIGIWAMGYDGNADELYDVIRNKFQIVPFYVLFNRDTPESRISEILSGLSLTVDENLGSGLYKVTPSGVISSTQMTKLKGYNEVIKTDFEMIGKTRSIN